MYRQMTWNELAKENTQLKKTTAEFETKLAETKRILEKVKLVHEELFAELGNKRAGDWGIINDGLVEFEKLRKALTDTEIKDKEN